MTEAERIETVLLTFKATITGEDGVDEGIEWKDIGPSFIVPNLLTGEEEIIDLRKLAPFIDQYLDTVIDPPPKRLLAQSFFC